MNPSKSEAVLRRLSHYARCLRRVIGSGQNLVTSEYLAGPCGTTAASVRKDLSIFGEFGKRGAGYDTRALLKAIEKVLGIHDPPPLVLVGAGRIGRILAEDGIPGSFYPFLAVFDNDNDMVGVDLGEIRVRHTSEMKVVLTGSNRFIGIVAVTPGSAQEASDLLIECGCSSILCFNMEPVSTPDGISLRYVDMPTELDMLCYSLSHENDR